MSQAIKFHRVAAGATPSGGWTKGHVYFVYNNSSNTGALKVCKDTSGTLENYTPTQASDIGAESNLNKVTSLSSSSTDIQYPSAKCVYDIITNNEESVSAALNELNTNKANKTDILYLKEITYSALKALRTNSQLVPGQQYRITDYNTTVTGNNYTVGGHQFDIIVVADSSNKLNESARAIQHSGDTYFSNSKLEAWELKYCLDNDTNRFAWANTSTGKGVIYWMKDEFRNECPYDFKNIMFYRKWDSTKSLWCDIATSSTSGAVPAYTFSSDGSSSTTSFTDYSLSKSNNVYSNVIKEYINSNKLTLNNNCFFGNDCYSNTFGNVCYYNTFGNYCRYNTFGNDCNSNTFGNDCNSNTFGNVCHSNTFGNDCDSNTFGNDCHSNTFGNVCDSNTFGNDCDSNTIESFTYWCKFRNGVSYTRLNFPSYCFITSYGGYYDFTIHSINKTQMIVSFTDESIGEPVRRENIVYTINGGPDHGVYKWANNTYLDLYTDSNYDTSCNVGDTCEWNGDAGIEYDRGPFLCNYNVESVKTMPYYVVVIYQEEYNSFTIHSININQMVVSFTDYEDVRHNNITFTFSYFEGDGDNKMYVWTNSNFNTLYTDSLSKSGKIGDYGYREIYDWDRGMLNLNCTSGLYTTTTVALKSNNKMVQYCEADLIADQD